jgi:hypothetical protein
MQFLTVWRRMFQFFRINSLRGWHERHHMQIRHTVKGKRETGQQLEMTAHSQYLQDLIIDNENEIIRYMRKEHCRNQQIRYTPIVAAAQYNG